MIGHKISLSKFKETELISSVFCYYNDMKLEINNKKKTPKKHKYMEAKQYATKQPMGH